jgi:hypothetical protein
MKSWQTAVVVDKNLHFEGEFALIHDVQHLKTDICG